MKPSMTLWAQATARAKHDGLRPIPCQRLDTSEAIWLVQSRSDPSYHYLLMVSDETIQCPCLQAHHRGICAHAAAVRLALEAQPPPPLASAPSDQTIAPSAPRRSLRSESEREQERQQRAEAERRERVLLWTDDRPFSIWKS